MARARNIKPGFFLNETMADLHPLTRLVFIGLWTIADFKGCVEWRPKRIKIQVMPYDDHDLEAAANDLQKAGFLARYEVDGERYIKINNFAVHQNPHKNERESGSDIPDLPEAETVETKEDTEKPEKIGTSTELIESKTEPLVPLTDSLNPITDTGFPQGEAPHPLASVADEMAIKAVEDAFGIRLDPETQKLVAQAVPPNLIELFPAFITGRAVGYAKRTSTEKLARISYALTDFQRDNKNGSTQKPPTAAERNWERTVANEQLGEDLRSGKLDQLLDELHRRDPLYRHEILPPGESPAALTGSVDDYGEGLDRFS